MRLAYLLAFALSLAVLAAAPASAQRGGFRPECRSFGDPQACSCALDNGGYIDADPYRPGRKRWRAARRGTAAHMAFMNCTGAR
jgi:hypothetical protein